MDDVTPTGAVRVLVVDDDALVRSGLTLILGGSAELEVVGQGDSGAHGVALTRDLRPDVVLMDIRMPGMDGIEATRRIRSDGSPSRVIVLTTFDGEEYVVPALAAGASGFLLKDTPPEQIVRAVLAVADGEPMLSPSVTERLIARVRAGSTHDAEQAARGRLAELTEREHDVAVAVGRELSNAEIAAELYLSVPTVKAHLGRIFAKLGFENRVQVAICVHDAG